MQDSDDPLAWETVDRRTAYTCEGFDVVTDTVRLPDGTETEYDHVTESESVVVLPLLADGADRGRSPGSGSGDGPGSRGSNSGGGDAEAVGPGDRTAVLVEEWRQAVGRVNRGLPAGGIEPADEDPAAAARRELREETGHVAGSVEHMVAVEPANGLLDSVFHYFLARDCRPASGQELDDDESIRVATTSLGELRDAVARGELRDGRAVLGVLYHQLHG